MFWVRSLNARKHTCIMRVLAQWVTRGQQPSEKATQHLLRSFSLRRRFWVAFLDGCCPLATCCARTLIIHVCQKRCWRTSKTPRATCQKANIYLPPCMHLHYKTKADHSIGPSAYKMQNGKLLHLMSITLMETWREESAWFNTKPIVSCYSTAKSQKASSLVLLM